MYNIKYGCTNLWNYYVLITFIILLKQEFKQKKMMTIEEKAKAYDEAIVRAEELKYVSDKNSLQCKTIEHIFPGLAESEDEKIRKKLINYFSNVKGFSTLEYNYGITNEDVVTWLKKQGEQKPSDIIPKDFEKYVEQLLSLSDGEGHGSPAKVREVSLKLLKLAKIGQKPVEWSEEDETLFKSCITRIQMVDSDATLIDWLKSLKVRVQQKCAWSEEDYNEIETIACHLDNINNEGMAKVLRNIRDKYYHIISQKQWKPTEEQMKVLSLCNVSGLMLQQKDVLVLKSLYEDLKAL